jgi:hypothetical protein
MLPNGKVLVAGGYNSSGNPIAGPELYEVRRGVTGRGIIS